MDKMSIRRARHTPHDPAELPERHMDLAGRAQAPLPVVLIRDEGPQVAHLHGVSHAELGVIFNSQGRLVSLLDGGETLFLSRSVACRCTQSVHVP